MAPSQTVSDDVQEALARHAEAVATVRAFAERSGAERVVLLVDPGDGSERHDAATARAAARWS